VHGYIFKGFIDNCQPLNTKQVNLFQIEYGYLS